MKEAEKMRAFFAARVDGYDEHMLTNIEGIAEAYQRVADLLPPQTGTLLDLGCGTGLELEAIFRRFPDIAVTGIDLTPEMLSALAAKYPNRNLTLICGSYLDVDFGESRFDTALSFETLHHFTHDEKRGLYRRLVKALRPGGVYVEADYTAQNQAEEDAGFAARAARLGDTTAASASDWHIDVPCTVENQIRLLQEAGFASVSEMWRCGATAILLAQKV